MLNQTSTTAIARTLLLAGILLVVTVLAARSFLPAFAQENQMDETISYDENDTEPVATYTASDPEGEGVTWKVTDPDSADAVHMDFDITDGRLTFKNPPDFEAPEGGRDGDKGNTYKAMITVSDTSSAMVSHPWIVTVNVMNVNEPGEVSLSHPQPKQGTQLTATLSDADREIDDAGELVSPVSTDLTDAASTTWRWYRSESKEGPWGTPLATSTINSEHTNTRTPEPEDANHYLRATAMYYDGEDTEQMRVAHGISANAVEMKEYVNTPPMFRDDNDQVPDSQIVMSVPEDESLEEGDAVGQPVTATDIGQGGMQEVLTYTITDDANNDEDLFTIDPASGQLKLAAATEPILDFEHDINADGRYEVTVQAEDPSGLTATTEVTINITEVDEAPSIEEDDASEPYAERGTTAVITYTATDEDAGDNNADLSWRLSGRDASDFNITETGPTGELTFVSSPNYERPVDNGSNNVYDVVVEVADDAGNKDTRNVTVTVTNAEDLTTFDLTSHPQPEVGQAIRITLKDEDLTGRVTWNWDIDGGAATSSQVTGASASYTPRVAGDLVVEVSYEDSIDGRRINVPVVLPSTANDVQDRPSPDDEKPDFLNENGERSIAENQTGTVPGGAVTAIDDDNTLLYTLGGRDASAFTLQDRTSGQLVVAEGTELDHERKDTYSLTITATDPTGGSDRATQNVTITVTDVPEPPEITSGDTAISYAENGTGIVQRYTATDDENDAARPREPLVWSLSRTDAGVFRISNAGVLTFNSPPNHEAAADNGGNNGYVFTVEVSDGDTGTANATEGVVVTVTNVEEPGEVTGLPAQPKVEVPMSVTLTDPDGPTSGDGDLGDDNDPTTLTDNASTTWQWSRSRSRSSGWTTIVATTTMNVDVNTNTRTPEPADVGHYLRATAMYSDGEGDDKVAHGISTRVVLAEEYINSAPMFRDDDEDEVGSQITMEVNEDNSLEAGDPVGQPVTATDTGPAGSQEILVYTLDLEAGDDVPGSDQLLFTIDSSTGQLKLAGADTTLDYEDPSDENDDNNYVVRVKAIDPSNASSTVEVTIEVQPVDENPQIEAEDTDTGANLASTSTPESNATTSLSSYTAEDDETENNDLTWMKSGADEAMFSLCTSETTTGDCGDVNAESDSNTVYLWFKPSDFEARADSGGNNVYDVTITVTDDEMTDVRRVAVTLTNVDENGAVTLSNLQPEVGTEIRGTLDDPDGGETAVEWKWEVTPEDQDPTDCLLYAGAWGDLRAPDSPSYTPVEPDAGRCLRATASYNDRVPNVDDPDSPDDESTQKNSTSTIANFHVQAKRATNATPQFSDQDPNRGGNQTVRYIEENSMERAGVVVNSNGETPANPVTDDYVTASDADGMIPEQAPIPAVPADVLTYTLSGSDRGSFDINRATGKISVKAGVELDYETKTTYTVVVTATDSSLASDSITVTINVVNENEPPFVTERGLSVSGPAAVSYEENSNAVVGSYSATGPDATGASLTLEGTDRNLFSLSQSGELTFNASPNFESPADQGGDNNYSLIVRAAMGSLADTQNVTVTVENVDEDGEVRFTSTPLVARVGVELEAELDEADDETNVTWQWASGGSTTGPWTSIGGATNATYTPLANDVGDYLQVTASYTDASFGSDSLSAVTPDAVAPESTAGTPGSLALSPTTQLTAGDSVTATLTDADNPTNQVWLWQRSADGSTNWTTISGATSASYITTAADAGNYLRATVTYDDSSGTGLTLDASTSSAVKLHRYDGNSDGEIQRDEVINAINDYLFPADPANPTTTRQDVIDLINLYLFPQE